MTEHEQTPGRAAPVYGVVAEFDEPEALVAATERAYDAGYRRLDAYSPFPVHGLAEATGFRRTFLPLLVLGGGLSGAAAGFLMQYIGNGWHYPLNVGGRPLLSWPSFIPITFEIAILAAAFTAGVGMILLNGLPRPHHPIFNAPNFERATTDGFFLCIEARDPRFDLERTQAFLRQFNPRNVAVVEDL